MQIILVSGRLKTARTLTIMPRHMAVAVLAFFCLVFATSALLSWLSVQFRLPLVQELVLSLQRRETREAREFVQNNLQMMASRLGELQAQVWQLDSVSERLSTLAGVKKEAAPREPLRPAGQGGLFVAAPLSATELQREIERLTQVLDDKTNEFTMLESRLLEKRVQDRMLPTTLPVSTAAIGSGFGYRTDPFAGVRALHEGIDFVAEIGTPVVAAAAGVVIAAHAHPEYGKMVDIDHGGGLTSRYAHLSKIQVMPGQIVKGGTRLGAVGSTGRSTGPHLHFEVRMLGVAQNPLRFLKRGEAYAQARRR